MEEDERPSRRGRWVGIATVTAIALVAGVIALTRDDPAPADRTVVTQTDPSIEPTTEASPSPTDEPTPTPSASEVVAESKPDVVGPLPKRPPRAPIAPCTPEETAALKPAKSESPPLGLWIYAMDVPGSKRAVAPGGTWTYTVRVENRADAPITFTDLGAHPAWIDTRPGLAGVGSGAPGAPATRTLAKWDFYEFELRVTSRMCGSAGRHLPFGTYHVSSVLRTDQGNWGSFGGGSLWVIDPEGRSCFPMPDLPTSAPVDGLTATAGEHFFWHSSAYDNGADPDFQGRLDEPIDIAISFNNETDQPITFTELDPSRRLSYLVENGAVTGGWGSSDTSTNPVRHTVQPSSAKAEQQPIRMTISSTACAQGQPQTPGRRTMVVGLLVERDGVTYHWAIPVMSGPDQDVFEYVDQQNYNKG